MAEVKLISAESVTEGHPDKICDQISDAILDDMLRQDPHSHVAVETSATKGQFWVFGEVPSKGYSDIQSIVRDTVRRIGYTSSVIGLDADSCGVLVSLSEQSPEINQGVSRIDSDRENAVSREERYEAQGAGDQGVMTIRGEPSSMCPSASGTIYPTQSISLTFASALPPSITETASSGTNLGSVVITVLPAALCGISSRARSRSNSLFISGSTSDSIKRLINVDFPVRTGPTTPT